MERVQRPLADKATFETGHLFCFQCDINQNKLTNTDKLLVTSWPGVSLAGNKGRGCVGRWIELGGGSSLNGLSITGNVAKGDFSGVVTGAGSSPDAPIFAYSTGVTDSRIEDNTFIHTGGTAAATPMLLDDSRTTNNRLSGNRFTNFADRGRIANPLQNNSILSVDLSTIGPVAGMTSSQRIVSTRTVTGVLPGDEITLLDLASGGWSSPAGVMWNAFCGEPGTVHIVFENLNGSSVSIPGMNFRLFIYRKQS